LTIDEEVIIPYVRARPVDTTGNGGISIIFVKLNE
jgi:hypothetical protein